MTPPVLYHHFGSKAGLYTAVVEATVDAIVDAMAAAPVTGSGMADRVEAVLAALVELRRSHPRAPGLLERVEQDVAHHPELAELRRVVERIPAFWDSIGDDAGAPDPTRLAIRALLEGFVRSARHARSDAAYAAAGGALAAIVRDGLR